MSEENKIPTKEEILALIKEQIEVKTAQLALQELNEKMAKSRAAEFQAIQFIAQMQGAGKQEQEHTLTEQDLIDNPELVEQGFVAGDSVLIPMEQGPAKSDRKLKKA